MTRGVAVVKFLLMTEAMFDTYILFVKIREKQNRPVGDKFGEKKTKKKR
jgi:hypothetical protein